MRLASWEGAVGGQVEALIGASDSKPISLRKITPGYIRELSGKYQVYARVLPGYFASPG